MKASLPQPPTALIRKYEILGRQQGTEPELLRRTLETVRLTLRQPSRPAPILSLKHLALASGVPLETLRSWIGRHGPDPYTVFLIPKRGKRAWLGDPSEGMRRICAPNGPLLRVQRYIARAALARVEPHQASTAFAPGCCIRTAATPHRGSRWLIKIDVKGFFESISEVAVYRVFRGLGYQPLVAFEMTRLCTRRAGQPGGARAKTRWLARRADKRGIDFYRLHGQPRSNRPTEPILIGAQEASRFRREYRELAGRGGHLRDELLEAVHEAREREERTWATRMGYLPQGAPTSPMLANLVARPLDEALEAHAHRSGLVYTRYADDMTFSTARDDLNFASATGFVREAYAILARHGLQPNLAKTRIRGPGSRKVVLGLVVDDPERPRLPREFRDRMRMHFYYLRKLGPATHAEKRGFRTVLDLRLHLEGLVFYARDVDPSLGEAWQNEYKSIPWPI
jgi:hypothetical protein